MKQAFLRERTTPGGAIIVSRCIKREKIANAHWLVWRDTSAGVVIGNWIELAVETIGDYSVALRRRLLRTRLGSR